MKIIEFKPGYNRHTYIVELTEEEQQLSDQQKINLADNRGKDPDRQMNFGGTVKCLGKNTYRIDVYTD